MMKHELEAKVESLEHQLAVAEEGFATLLAYVQSHKFTSTDGMVNAHDIVTRVYETIGNVADAALVPYGLCTDVKIAREIAKNGYTHIIVRYAGSEQIQSHPKYLDGYDMRRSA